MAGENPPGIQVLPQTASMLDSFTDPRPLLSSLLGMPVRLFCIPGQLLFLLELQLMSSLLWSLP